MALAPLMVMTRHQDKPGTMGRIGLILGEAAVNISSMTLARTESRHDALMLLAVDDEVPDAARDGHQEPSERPRRLGHPHRRALILTPSAVERPRAGSPSITGGQTRDC